MIGSSSRSTIIKLKQEQLLIEADLVHELRLVNQSILFLAGSAQRIDHGQLV